MARKPKPRLHQGWYVTEAGGKFTKLCRESEGFARAVELLSGLLGPKPDTPAPVPIPPAGGITVREAIDRFLSHARTYYRLPSGKVSREVENYAHSFRELLTLYGPSPAGSLDRKALKVVREGMVTAGLSRKVVNQRIGRVQRAFRWLAEEEHLPDTVAASLSLLRPLPAFRSTAPEREPVKPVDIDTVLRTLRHLSEPWATMVRVQWWTGLRPEEVCFLRLSMLRGIDRQMVEVDFGLAHKMGYKGKVKRVTLGPMAVAAVTPFLYVASVRGVDPIFRAPRGRGKVPGQAKGAVQRHSYSQAISRVCEEYNIPHWHPNQLRHTRLTLVRAAHGLDAAQAAGGHAKADVTQVYAEVDRRAAERVARLMG